MRRMKAKRIVCLALLGGFLSTNPALALQPQEELEPFEPKRVTIQDVTLLAKSDLSDETTLVFLETRELDFELDAKTISRLRDQGVSDEVIQFLLNKSARSESSEDRVVYASTTLYPSWYYGYPAWYYGFYYTHDPYSHYGHSVSHHWVHGGHGSGDHHSASRSRRHSDAHSASYDGRGHGSGRHRSTGQGLQGHGDGSSGGDHLGSGHSTSSGHKGKGHGRRGHGGGRSGGRGHRGGRGGGHGGGHGGGGH